MGRLARIYSKTGIYHIVFRGVNQQSIFEEASDYEKLIKTIEKVKEEMNFEIYAYCFMSNHVHLLIKEKIEYEVSLIMKRILVKYARWYNIKYGRSGALIANRYKSVPVEIDEYFLQLIRYIHQNPVEANMVHNLEEYLYRSYCEYLHTPRIIDNELVFSMISMKEFIEFHTVKGEFKFKVTDRTGKTDDELRMFIAKHFKITNPKEIALMPKYEKIKVLEKLKENFSARQIQRVTGVSRGLIGKMAK